MRRRRFDNLAARGLRPTRTVYDGGIIQPSFDRTCFGAEPWLWILPHNVSATGIRPVIGPAFTDTYDLNPSLVKSPLLDSYASNINGWCETSTDSKIIGYHDFVVHCLIRFCSVEGVLTILIGANATDYLKLYINNSDSFRRVQVVHKFGAESPWYLNGDTKALLYGNLYLISYYMRRDGNEILLYNGGCVSNDVSLYAEHYINTDEEWKIGRDSVDEPYPNDMIWCASWTGDNLITDDESAIADHNARLAAIVGDGARIVHRVFDLGRSSLNLTSWAFADLTVDADCEVYSENVDKGMVCAPSDQPRASSRGLEVHPAKDYLLAPTQEWLSDDWSSSELTVTDEYAESPDGMNLAAKLDCTAVNGTHYAQASVTVSADTEYVFSICIKSLATNASKVSVAFDFVSSTEVAFALGANTGNDDVMSVDIGDGWYRYSFRWTSGSGDGVGTIKLYVWGNYVPE